jgi:hypothetical protein
MSVVIFTGPTLSADRGRELLDARYLPPAAQGDVYSAALVRPKVIGIIDGYFDSQPAVWHKEILWAMAHGIHVFGSASMGALRAAELADFGMEGVGAIYQAYRDGVLEDDDEVAVVHEPEEHGFRPASEAMVDIRCTLAAAVAAGVISVAVGDRLEAVAKSIFYPRRTYSAMVRMGAELGLAAAELNAFLEWLPDGKRSQKQADAIAMLRAISTRIEAGLEPKQVAYTFQHSVMWEQARRLAGDISVDGDSKPGTVASDAVLDELRLEGERYLEIERSALVRALAANLAELHGFDGFDGGLERAERDFWRRRGIGDEESKRSWMQANDLDEHQLAALLADDAKQRWVRQMTAPQVGSLFLDQLRISGDYPRLIERSRAKRLALEQSGLADPRLADAGLELESLLRWYFEERLGSSVPPDPGEYARELGCADYDEFKLLILREYCYLRQPGN